MTIYVLTKAYVAKEDYLNILDTQVFKSLDEARKGMKEEVDDYLNSPEDDWNCNWGDDKDSISVNLSCNDFSEEVVWAISEHEI